MQRISTSSAVADLFGIGKAGFRNGDLPRGVLPTAFNAEWCNHVQEEICNVIEGAGVALNPDKRDQLLAALKKLIDEQAGGKGLPVGAVVGFPRAVTNPEGYLKADGSTFAQATYPDLYRVLGGNKLPKLTRSDVGMTAYFPVTDIPDGWIKYDEIATRVTQAAYPELYRKLVAQYGSIAAVPKAEDRFIRNASGSLAVGTQQGDAIRNIKGSLEALYGSYRYTLYTKAEGAFTTDSDDGVNTTFRSSNDDHANRQKRVVFDASRSVPTADEVRPKAIAMVLCIKAKDSLDDVVMWIKAYGKVTNAGTMDAATLAADIQRKANRDEVAPKSHSHRAAEINDFAEAVAALTVHQKIGTFDIYKDPGGRMIQAGTVQVLNHNNQLGGRILTWPVAFVDTPHVVLTLSGKDINVVDVFVTYDHTRTDKTQVCYWIYENATNKAAEVTVNFVAVGRWK